MNEAEEAAHPALKRFRYFEYPSQEARSVPTLRVAGLALPMRFVMLCSSGDPPVPGTSDSLHHCLANESWWGAGDWVGEVVGAGKLGQFSVVGIRTHLVWDPNAPEAAVPARVTHQIQRF